MSSGDALDETSAGVFARALSSLTARTTVRRPMGDKSGEATDVDRDTGTLTGQLSKHAPTILVAHARAVAAPLSTIPAKVRKHLQPGLFALCEAISAGGKAQQRGSSSGQGIGEAFGLGEGSNAEAEWEVWGELWNAWAGKRYAGQG